MAISIIDGFNVTSALPADLKTVISTSSSLTSISSSWRYNGMLVYTQAEGQEWRLIGGVSDSNWKLISISGSSSSSSYASTASFALNAGSGTTLTTGSTYPITSSWAITSSYLTGNISNSQLPSQINVTGITASLFFGTASVSNNSTTSSFSTYSLSSSYLIGYTIPTLVSSSLTSISSSFASSSISSSYSSTASYALNAGSGISLVTGSTYPITSSWANNVITASYAYTSSYLQWVNLVNTSSVTQVGYQAGQNISTSSLNAVQIGYQAGKNSTNSTQVVQIGYGAGLNSTTALNSVQIGYGAGSNSTTAQNSIQIGSSAGQNASTANNSVQIGYQAGRYSTVGSQTVQVGGYAGLNSTTASNATQVGYSAGYNSTQATQATQIGYNAGYNSVTGSNSTMIGANADALTTSSNIQNSIAIGYNAKVSTPNTCVIGGTGSNAVNVSIGNTTAVNALDVTGNISCSVITASLFLGSASYAGTASILLGSVVSSSYSSTASYALNAGSGTSLVTASTYPITSSWANNVITASYVSSSTYAPYIQSRQLNLVTNGSGLLNNNYNFSGFIFDSVETYGGGGSFKSTAYNKVLTTDEYLPVDITQTYTLGLWGKSGNLDGSQYSSSAIQYIGVAAYDIDQLSIVSENFMKYSGSTDTFLAATLSSGSTTVQLVNATGWANNDPNSFARSFAWYPYTNSKGYSYPNFTYTRYWSNNIVNGDGTTGTWATGSIVGNTITLLNPWPGPTIASGSAIRNNTGGATYKYIISGVGVSVPNTWTYYNGSIGGIDISGSNTSYVFPYGTSYVKVLLLPNYNQVTSSNVIRLSNVTLSEISVPVLNAISASYLNATNAIATNLASNNITLTNYITNPTSTAVNSNIIGNGAGFSTSGGSNNFIGQSAGTNAGAVSYLNAIGTSAGQGASNSNYSNFIGYSSGLNAIYASQSIFIGYNSGNAATSASNSTFIGQNAGYQATNASNSNFFGTNAGYSASYAKYSNFIGYNAGRYAPTANNSIFIGYQAGFNDTVNNSSGPKSSILIGDYTSTNGFSDSISIGKGSSNSATNQINLGNSVFINGIYASSTTTSASQANVKVGIGTFSPVNALDVNGNISCSVITASLYLGTASYANNALSASYAPNLGGSSLTTGSTYPITSSWSINSISASYFSGSVSNAITATTASYILANNVIGTVLSSSYSTTSSYAPLILPSQINVTGVTASLFGSASYSITSSYAPSSSFTTNAYIAVNALDLPILTANGDMVYKSNVTATYLSIGSSSLYLAATGQNETVLQTVTLTGSVGSPVTISWNAAISEYDYGRIKYGLFRIRRTYVSGSILDDSDFGGISDDMTGLTYIWNSFYIDYSPTDYTYVLTVQETGGSPSTQIYSAYNNLTASFGSSNLSRIPIGSNNQVLTVSASIPVWQSISSGSGTTLTTGSTYPITSSWALTSSYITSSNISGLIPSASYSTTSSYALNGGSGITLITGSTYPITSSRALTSSAFVGNILNSQLPSQINVTGITASNIDVINNIVLGGTITNAGNLPNTSVVIGAGTGYNATNAGNSSFIGTTAGYNATNANNSTFIGSYAGQSATNANNSNFLGTFAGGGATNSSQSNFIGPDAGYNATNAGLSNFIGQYAGFYATNANNSIFIGNNAGSNSSTFTSNANNSIFIGNNAGLNDTVNNSAGNSSILIGDYTSTGGNSDSISIGKGTKNSTNNQVNIGNSLFINGIYAGTSSISVPQTNVKIGIGINTPINSLDVIGNISASIITASLFYGTSSYALYALNGASGSSGTSLTTGSTYPITSSWAISASWAPINGSSSYALTSDFSVIAGNCLYTSSYAITASYALNGGGTSSISSVPDIIQIQVFM